MAKIIRLDVSNKEWVYECKCGETEFFILFDRPDLDTACGFQCSNCNKVIKFEDPVLESQLVGLRDENAELRGVLDSCKAEIRARDSEIHALKADRAELLLAEDDKTARPDA